MANNDPSIFDIENIRPKFEFGTKTAALYLSITPKVLAERRDAGRIIGYKPGRYWLYTKDSLDAYLETVKSGRSN